MQTKKSISAIIGVVLLIVISIILITILLNFGKEATGDLDNISETPESYFVCDYGVGIKLNLNSNFLTVINSSSKNFTLTGYSLISKESGDYLNTFIELEEPIFLAVGRSTIIELACLPEKQFLVELVFKEDNCYVSRKLSTIEVDLSLCSENSGDLDDPDDPDDPDDLIIPDGITEVPEINEDDFYEFWYLEHLLYINTNSITLDNDYLLMRDLNFNDPFSYYSLEINEDWVSGDGWVPIGNSSLKFTGVFDGNGYTINNLYINRPSVDYQGFFGYADTAEIGNVGLEDINVLGDYYVGGLVGYNYQSVIENNYSAGFVSGVQRVAGLIGTNTSSSIVSKNYSIVSVSGTGRVVGGLVGSNTSSSIVSNNYSTGDVSGDGYVGGLVGSNSSSSTVYNSYSTGDVSGDNQIGGLVGRNYSSTVSNSYSTGNVYGIGSSVGGLVGNNYSSTVSNSYWDTETSGQSSSDGGTGKITSEMKQQSTFTPDWDFTTIWNITENTTYPFLRDNTQDPLPE
jgi:hypothetical protein